MGYTKDQADAELRKIVEGKLPATKAELTRIIENLSVEASGQKTVLYSGMDMNEIDKLAQDPKLRILNNTEAYKFVSTLEKNEDFIGAWKKITGETNPNFNDYNSPVGKFIGGEDPVNGKPRKMGAWDIISKNFVRETQGEVIALIGKNAKVGRVFFQTEFEALKHNSNVTKINGIDKLPYMLGLDIKDQYQLDKMKLESRAILLSGKNISDITQKDMEAILKNKEFAEGFKDIVAKYKPEELPKFYKHLKKIGTLGAILGFSTATYKANEAYSNGNPELAKEIMGTYASESAGGTVGGSALSTGTFMLLAAAGITVSAPAAIIIAVITSIVGGIVGSELGSYLYKNRDVFSYFLNPFDENWKGRDQEWLEEFKNFWQDPNRWENVSDTLSYFLNPFDPNFPHVLQDAKNFYSQLIASIFNFSIYDPLALDLNGDGKIGISPAPNGGAYFDHNGDGVSHRSSWISKEDGILAYDRNGNGKIDDGGELFGNFTQIKDKDGNQRLAKDGYEALKEFDSNNDGLIDNKDDKFKDLKIWQDTNSNGISDEGELKSLDELGIASLSLNHNEVNEDLGGGNTLSLKGGYTKTDGTAHSMGDLNFNVDTINSKFKDETPLNSEDMARANIKGFGLLRDLRSAAALNKDLASALDSYSRLSTKEEQLKALPALIKAWSETAARSTGGNSNGADYEVSLKGVKLPSNVNLGAGSNINVDADGNVINSGNPNARRLSLTPSQYQALLNSSNSIDESLLKEFESIKYKIKVIDAFTGSKTADLYYISNDDIKAIIKNTNETYEKILNYSYASLLAQTRLKSYTDLISLDMIPVPNDTAAGGASAGDNSKSDTASGGANASAKPKYDFRLNFTKVIDKFKEINLNDPKKAFVDLAEFATLFQNKKEFAAGLSLLAEFAYGANKRGVLGEYVAAMGQETQNKLDIATITSNSSGTNANDMMVGSEGADKLYGGEGNDAINGQGGNDIIYGGDGDDHAFGEWGNDTFEGGKGNDRLEGAWGDDTYIFGRGDGADTIYDFVGNDTIKFKEGVSLKDITVKRAENNINSLEISIKGTQDKITVENAYQGDGRYYNDGMIENFEFADGTKLSLHELETQAAFKGTDADDTIYGANANDEIHGGAGDDTIYANDGDDKLYGQAGNDKLYGGDGNDTIYGGEGNDAINGQGGNDIIYGGDGDDHAFGEWGNDTFEGGKGNDRLEGAWGDDTYIFGRGDGADTIYDFVGNDTIKFKEGVSKENITFQRVANDLVLKYGENDTVRINNQFGGGAIEQIALASGEYITASKINKIIEDLNAYATNNGMSNISMDDMKNNPDIMQMFASGWGN